jgi:hypothetical protein
MNDTIVEPKSIQQMLREEADRLEIVAKIMRLAAERIDIADKYVDRVSEAIK